MRSVPLFIALFGVAWGAEIVKYVAVLYRHGDRTPVDTYPTDPWRNESLWPVKFGELTNIGKQQHYALGQYIRKRYSHLISEKFDPTEIYVRSTDVDRTLMSAQANLAGVYPPVDTAIWNKDLMWQPIPVHTVPEAADELLSMGKPCPTFNRELDKYIHSKAYRDRLSKYQPLMDYLTAYTGKKVKSYYDIDSIYSVLYIEQLYNLTLPNWTTSVFPDKMVEPAGYSFTELTATPLMARLKVGPLLKQIAANMYNAITRKRHKYLKMSMYSGHDLTVGSFLNALGVYDGKCPVYTSTVFVELIFDNSTQVYSVRISYRNITRIEEPHVLTIPHCGQTCPVSRFVRLYEHLLTVNWDYECNKQFPQMLGICIFIGLGLFLMIYVGHKVYFTRVTRQHRYDLGYSGFHPLPVSPINTAPAPQYDVAYGNVSIDKPSTSTSE